MPIFRVKWNNITVYKYLHDYGQGQSLHSKNVYNVLNQLY